MKSKITILLMVLGLHQVHAQKTPGVPDSSYNGNGLVLLDMGSEDDMAQTGALASDGTVWVAGYSDFVSIDMTYTRVKSDGTIDAGFKSQGIGRLDFQPNGTEVIRDLHLMDDGTSYGVGITEGPADYDVMIIKMNANGVLDGAFGTGGAILMDIGGDDDPVEVMVDDAGNIVIAGQAASNGDYDFFVLRLLPDGTRDSSFSADGMVKHNTLNVDNYCSGIVERPKGGYYVYGSSIGNSEGFGTIISVSKNGNINIDLGGPGVVNFKKSGFNTMISNLEFFNESLIFTGSFEGKQGNSDGFVARMEANGTLNSTFGDSGYIDVMLNLANQGEEELKYLAITSDSILFVGGNANYGFPESLVGKYTIKGVKDPFFGNLNGLSTFKLPDAGITGYNIMDMFLDEEKNRLHLVGTAVKDGKKDFYSYAIFTGSVAGPNTAITEVSSQSIKFYPNPSKGRVNADLNQLDHGTVYIYNVSGQLMDQMEYAAQMTLSDKLPNGLYFIKVIAASKQYNTKLYLQR